MPSVRTELSREEKIEEVLDAAERRLEVAGYEGLSVVGLAREIGVAQNAVYHYFPSKDHLFVATLERLLGRIAERKPRAMATQARVLWFVDQLAVLAPYRATLYDRAGRSPVVQEFVAALDQTLERMLTNAVAELAPQLDARVAADALRAVIEGAYVQRLSRARRRELVGFLLARLAG